MKTKLLLIFLVFVTIQMNAQQKIYDFKSTPSIFKTFNDKIIFYGNQEDTGRELWQSDGTSSNTTLLKDIYPGTEPSVKSGSAILNGKFYFMARDESSEGEIWQTDGTESGTTKVTNFINGKTYKLTVVGNYIFFLVGLDSNHLQVWKTDGTTGGTVLIKDILNIWNNSTFEGKCNDTFIFTIQPASTMNSRVWRSDGTSDGTFPITSEMDGNGSDPGGTTGLTQYIVHNNKLYFVNRYSLYETDGTLQNTKTIGNVWNGQNNVAQYSDVIEANNSLYFMFYSSDIYKLSIFKFDDVTKNVSEVYTNTSNRYFSPSNFSKTDSSLLFCASNATGGTSLLSLSINDYSVTDLKELAKNDVQRPDFFFVQSYDVATIYKIKQDEYFITSGVDEKNLRKGWIVNNNFQAIENISALDNIVQAIVYKDNLYYGKDKKFWKYANNLGVGSLGAKSTVAFYPNPSTNFINIQTENDNQIDDIQIFDLNGQSLTSESDFSNNKIDVSKLNQGTYILQAKINGAIISKKIIKK
ncbi:T9SS type A sorting domain-containing protein [Flavobacterium pectinovorum]|uniref:T9SS C-terminal target domain-containing protein n=1 Tax=Flavobacterium pectinovorum TaxID=29533 RepID=A0A502EX99_9FLAO|nr:T9SS type A sorting domain-containing protein [Flavobacterium pectinovorum]TPG41742.1 T9SS C-terminal target domain-containing protein [Flavobacterium pectinovorum]